MKAGCATALVLNKWDVARDAEEPTSTTSARGSPQAAPAPEGADRQREDRPQRRALLHEAITLGDRTRTRIPTPELNRFLAEIVAGRQPPAKQGHRLRLLYMAQFETRPPRFAIQVNSPQPGDARLRLLRRESAARAVRRWTASR